MKANSKKCVRVHLEFTSCAISPPKGMLLICTVPALQECSLLWREAQWYIDDRPVHFCSLLKLAIFVKCCKQQLIEYLNYSSNCDLWRAMLIVILYSHRNCFSVIFYINFLYIWYSYSVFSIFRYIGCDQTFKFPANIDCTLSFAINLSWWKLFSKHITLMPDAFNTQYQGLCHNKYSPCSSRGF